MFLESALIEVMDSNDLLNFPQRMNYIQALAWICEKRKLLEHKVRIKCSDFTADDRHDVWLMLIEDFVKNANTWKEFPYITKSLIIRRLYQLKERHRERIQAIRRGYYSDFVYVDAKGVDLNWDFADAKPTLKKLVDCRSCLKLVLRPDPSDNAKERILKRFISETQSYDFPGFFLLMSPAERHLFAPTKDPNSATYRNDVLQGMRGTACAWRKKFKDISDEMFG